MILDNSIYHPIHAASLNTKNSYYPYPVQSRQNVHSSIRGLAPLPSASQHSKQESSSRLPIAGPGPSSDEISREKRSIERAEQRALMGRRPAGVGLGREAEELSDEEDALEDEKASINMFGHRFLLPFGRRLTQMEMETAPSPTPSEADQDRRQEDRNMASPSVLVGGQVEDTGPGGEVDLDASVEDLDADVEDLDASMEGEEGDVGNDEMED